MDERQNGGALRGRELLRLIRFGVMAKGYLEEKARGMVPEEHRECMEALEGLVGEALRVKTAVLANGGGSGWATLRRLGRFVLWGHGWRADRRSGRSDSIKEEKEEVCVGGVATTMTVKYH